ncbi:sensor domain-containing diguanylate cyclase [Vibrio algicola]|uniref:diguanylate cyclase n=1 Tax=Vibrio algicola TaxID=2662262 RepID=A0A5Q0TI24_9VIBR|nr:diguanylate cyclase [Vibrio algicola]
MNELAAVNHALPVSNNIAPSSEGYIKDYLAKFALDSISELVFFKDANGQVSGTNRAYDRFWLEREAESCAKLSWDDQTSRATVKRWTTLPTGESCLLETHISALMGDAGIPIGTIGITHDVTEWYNTEQSFLYEMERRQNMEIELAQRDTMLQSLMNASPDPIAIFNQNRVHEACNQPYADSLGIANPDMLIGQRLENLLPIELVERFKQSDLEVLKEGKTIRFVDTTENTAGELNWYDIVKAPYTDPLSNTTGCLLMARDITARMHAEQQLAQANAELEQLSFFDELTKVANRRRFEVELKAIWALHLRQSSPFTIIICDIDYFKKYNQLYGREQGDITLTKVAQALKSVPLRGADLVARYLDGQFVFLLPETKMPGCLHIADKIHQVIADLNIEHAKSPISDKLTVSLGVSSLIPRRSMLESEFIALAEDALAQAKEKGRMQTQVQLLNDDYTPTIHASRRGGVDESN